MAYNSSVVVDKAKSVVSENLKNSLSIPTNAITPSTLTAMVGMSKGMALKIAPSVTGAVSQMQAYASSIAGSDPTLAADLTSAAGKLSSQASNIMSGMPGVFNQVVAHVKDSQELKSAMDYMSNIKFSDMGSGITNMTSMLDQGLTASLGDLGSAATAIEKAGSVFGTTNLATLGSPGGLVESLTTNKLSNFSGLSTQLAKAGVDTTQLSDPAFAPQISTALSKITDPAVLKTVTNQFGLTAGSISNLGDLTNLTKLTGSSLPGLTGGLSGLSTKLGDLGASFPTPTAAANMLKNIEVPSLPALDSFAPSLSSLIDTVKADVANLTGSGSGPEGLPNVGDFMSSVTGNQLTAQLAAKTSFSSADVTALTAHVDSVNELFSKAGIDVGTTFDAGNPATKLSSIMTFGTSLHGFGADQLLQSQGSLIGKTTSSLMGAAQTGFTGAADTLKQLADTSNPYGQAILASLAEGKNKALMAANNISPLKFGS